MGSRRVTCDVTCYRYSLANELRSRNTWGDRARDVIVEEMKRIDVKFYFWLEVGSTNWQYTSLMGEDNSTF